MKRNIINLENTNSDDINSNDKDQVSSENLKISKKKTKTKAMAGAFYEFVFSKAMLIVLVLFCASGISGSIYFYQKYKNTTKDPVVLAKERSDRLLGLLDELIELPQDETPTIMTVSDKDKLKGQTFFDMVENGDILFAYTNAKKAVLYRPSIHKVVNMAPISIDQSENTKEGVKDLNSDPIPKDNKDSN